MRPGQGAQSRCMLTWKSNPMLSPRFTIISRACRTIGRGLVATRAHLAACAEQASMQALTAPVGCNLPQTARGPPIPRTFLAAMAKKGGKRNSASTRCTSSAFFGRGTDVTAFGAAAVPVAAALQSALLRRCGTLVACSGQGAREGRAA